MACSCMLTTHDNPYNPFDEFIPWFLFDIEKGYNSCGILARYANFSDDMSDKEEEEENERAIDEVIANDFLNIYKKVWSPARQEQQNSTGKEEVTP